MTPQPGGARLFLNRREGAPHRVLADDSLHAQKLRHNAVAAQRRDMGVARVSRNIDSIAVPRTSRALGAFGLV